MQGWNIGNVIERMLWTFIQAAIGSLPATFALTKSDLSAVGWTALTAGIAAVVSAAKNLTAAGIQIQAAKQALAEPVA